MAARNCGQYPAGLMISGLRRRDIRGYTSIVAGRDTITAMRLSVFALAFAGAALLAAAPIDRKDVEFAHPGAKPLLLDLHVPDGPGPFPAAILVHGGGFD